MRLPRCLHGQSGCPYGHLLPLFPMQGVSHARIKPELCTWNTSGNGFPMFPWKTGILLSVNH